MDERTMGDHVGAPLRWGVVPRARSVEVAGAEVRGVFLCFGGDVV